MTVAVSGEENTMTKKEWAYFEGKGFKMDIKQLSAEDLSYLIDLLVEEMAVRIEHGSDSSHKEKGGI